MGPMRLLVGLGFLALGSAGYWLAFFGMAGPFVVAATGGPGPFLAAQTQVTVLASTSLIVGVIILATARKTPS